MKRLMIVSTFLLFHFNGDAQSQITTPATPDQVEFLRYVMSSIASPFIDPQVAKMNAADFVILFGLINQFISKQTSGSRISSFIQLKERANDFRLALQTVKPALGPASQILP